MNRGRGGAFGLRGLHEGGRHQGHSEQQLKCKAHGSPRNLWFCAW